jgi:hypothetical protein
MYLEGGKIFHSKKLDLLLKVLFARKLMSKISKNAPISGGLDGSTANSSTSNFLTVPAFVITAGVRYLSFILFYFLFTF